MRTGRTLTEALPYLRRYFGKTFVIKYGGHAMEGDKMAAYFASDIVLLKTTGINPIVVHGGGPQIGKMLARLDIKSQFIDGLRVTDAATVEVVEMVLSGRVNKQIVNTINRAGGMAIGISGKDGNLIRARKLVHKAKGKAKPADLGFVGDPDRVDATVLTRLSAAGMIPVIAPVGVGDDGETYNINADTVAGAVAAAASAARLFLLTDAAGVLDKQKNLIPELTVKECRKLMRDGTITGGMIPKLETCIEAVEGGVDAAVILDGRIPHVMLLEIFTAKGVGTLIRKG
ncbi:MAG: acetylglutamate kinase [Alphaproteobacteria bacterium]